MAVVASSDLPLASLRARGKATSRAPSPKGAKSRDGPGLRCIASYRVVSCRIVSYRIASYR
eukprot:10293481-Lingulodinium_polyedra.AAC.1